jgi:hypothetical protein
MMNTKPKASVQEVYNKTLDLKCFRVELQHSEYMPANVEGAMRYAGFNTKAATVDLMSYGILWRVENKKTKTVAEAHFNITGKKKSVLWITISTLKQKNTVLKYLRQGFVLRMVAPKTTK